MEVDISCQVVDESSCTICAEIFLDPVVLCCVGCDRSFCNSCLEQFWIQHGCKECPLCFKDNNGLPHKSCKAHGEKLSLLCVADLEPVCSMCYRSGRHMNHIVYPIREAFKDHKVSWIRFFLFMKKGEHKFDQMFVFTDCYPTHGKCTQSKYWSIEHS